MRTLIVNGRVRSNDGFLVSRRLVFRNQSSYRSVNNNLRSSDTGMYRLYEGRTLHPVLVEQNEIA